MWKLVNDFMMFMRYGSDPKLRSAKKPLCKHDWTDRGHSFKRFCDKCGAEEWLFENPYPSPGEARYEWIDMTGNHLKYL